MRIGIYQSYWGALGGGGVYVGALAHALAARHEVELLHHRVDFDQAAYQRALGVDLRQINFRQVPVTARPEPVGPPWRRFAAEREWAADLSRPYDLFINSSETPPAFCHAPRGVLISWFPFISQSGFHGREDVAWRLKPAWRRSLEHRWHDFEWRRRFAGYQWTMTCSEYSRRWLKQLWGRDAHVVYPPMTRELTPQTKEPLVVSISRFQASELGHNKKHRDLIETFLQMASGALRGWRYVILGGLHPRPEDASYLESLQSLTAGTPVSLLANASGESVKDHLERATLFWHGTGFGENPDVTPGRMEHFGIATVEAMAAGCVPVVFGAGGQPEIVTHGKNGLLWRSLEELRHHSERAATDDRLRLEVSAAAQRRAADFSLEKFRARALHVLGPALGAASGG